MKGIQAAGGYAQAVEAAGGLRTLSPELSGNKRRRRAEASEKTAAVFGLHAGGMSGPLGDSAPKDGKTSRRRRDVGRGQEEKVEFLCRYRQADQRIQRKCGEMSLWRQRALQMTPVYSELPGGRGTGDRIQTAVEHICEIEEEINRDIDELVKLRTQVQGAIRSVKDQTLETLLEYRYIDGLTWEELAERMHYSYQWVCKLHGKALTCVALPEDAVRTAETVDSN